MFDREQFNKRAIETKIRHFIAMAKSNNPDVKKNYSGEWRDIVAKQPNLTVTKNRITKEVLEIQDEYKRRVKVKDGKKE